MIVSGLEPSISINIKSSDTKHLRGQTDIRAVTSRGHLPGHGGLHLAWDWGLLKTL